VPTPAERFQSFDDASLAELAQLVGGQQQAALATLDGGAPYTAMVAYVPEPDWGSFLVHLSDLSAHKGHLRADPRTSLLVFEPDDGRREILAHRRLSLSCHAELLSRSEPEYAVAEACYLARLPAQQLMFTLPGFDLVRLVPARGLFNAGFGRAYPVTVPDLAAAAHRMMAVGA
jgi:hypothetical protein